MGKLVNIEHEGRVVKISDTKIEVEILNKAACVSCSAKSVCSVSDIKAKIIEIPLSKEEYQVGEIVDVSLRRSMGYRAVWISYIIPLVIIMGLLLYLPSFKINELQVGLISLGSLPVYYLIIYLLRGKISKNFVFSIAKK